jgi:hypothetical protein
LLTQQWTSRCYKRRGVLWLAMLMLTHFVYYSAQNVCLCKRKDVILPVALYGCAT